MNDNNKTKIEEKVMAEIESGRVKLRSKYIFLAEKLGLGSAFALSVILAALFLNLFFFYLKASDNLVYLSFGNFGFLAFLESFPYLTVAVLIVMILAAGAIIKKSDFAYKRPFGYFAVGLIAFVMLSGIMFAYAGVAERIERFSRSGSGRIFFRSFVCPHCETKMDNGALGRTVEVGDGYLIIQTPRGMEKLDLKDFPLPENFNFEVGQFVAAVGEREDENVFRVIRIRAINEDEAPIIKEGVHLRFGPFAPMMPGRDGRAGQCFNSRNGIDLPQNCEVNP